MANSETKFRFDTKIYFGFIPKLRNKKQWFFFLHAFEVTEIVLASIKYPMRCL